MCEIPNVYTMADKRIATVDTPSAMEEPTKSSTELDVVIQESSHNIVKARRGATRHCCYGICRSDTRYADREDMRGVTWIPFPKPHRDIEKCKRWVHACRREGFTTDKITYWTYICSKHFVGENGPTESHPDPIPATYSDEQLEKLKKRRKAPAQRTSVNKKRVLDAAEALLSLQNIEKDYADVPVTEGVSADDTLDQSPEILDPGSAEKSCQTMFTCSDEVSYKITNIVSRRSASNTPQTVSEKFSFQTLSADSSQFHFYTGLTVDQFQHLFSFLGNIDDIVYWRGGRTKASRKFKAKQKLCPRDQVLLTLVKLRHGFPNRDMAYRFHISCSTVSNIINTWIQLLYTKTNFIRKNMFPSRELIKSHLPKCFRGFKNVRVIIDYFEIYAEQPHNFSEQGNMYSSYKNHCTFKVLVGIAPTGGISFLSDVFEGSISDKEIVRQCGLLDYLNPHDLVIADRGFDIKDLLQARQVLLNIPPFLKNRSKLTPQEEIATKQIARVRIHVERAIERMKNYKLIGRTVPLKLKPVISQIVHIIGFLVNYQTPLVS